MARLIDIDNPLEYFITFIGAMFDFKGQQPDEEKLESQANMLMDEIEKYFNNISIEEFEKAMNTGLHGNLGEYMGLNVATYYNWLRAYSGKPKYKSEDYNFHYNPTKDERNAAHEGWREVILKEFTHFKQTGEFVSIMPSMLYQSFVGKGLFKENAYETYLVGALQKIKANKHKEKFTGNATEIRSIIAQIDAGKDTPYINQLLQTQAKTDCIIDYYSKIKTLAI